MHSLNFQGTVTFLRGDKLQPMKYFHSKQNNVEQERMLSLNSPLREIIRQSDKVICLHKDTHQKKIHNRPFEDSFLLNIPQNIEELDAYYAISLANNEEKVALLPTYEIELNPKDQLRYRRKIWVEKNSTLPIKTETFDLTGNRIEAMTFTDLVVPALANGKKTAKSNNSETLATQADNAKVIDLNNAPITVSELPPGFRVRYFSQHPLENAESPAVNHLIIGDGLSFVSVYVEPAVKGSTLKNQNAQVQTLGSVKFYSQSLGNCDLTVMGEVPEATIIMIANSIKLKTTN